MSKYIPLLFLIFIFACKGTKEISSSSANKLSSKQLHKQMQAADFDFDYLQAKARIKFDDGAINQSFTANIRIQNNETIWMSLTGPFGIEGARILLSKNRVQIIDRLNGKYYDEKFGFIDNYLPFQTNLGFIQNLIVGNVFQEEISKQKHELMEDNYLIEDEFKGIQAKYTVSPSFKYRKVEMSEVLNERNIELDFNDYRFIEEKLFAMLRNIHFSENGKDVFVEMNFTKLKKESTLDFPFNVPDRMKN
tara:strand:+ start:425 stop:1171 length:747 start_codon:yes stop_codon:yes gene_type:complete